LHPLIYSKLTLTLVNIGLPRDSKQFFKNKSRVEGSIYASYLHRDTTYKFSLFEKSYDVAIDF